MATAIYDLSVKEAEEAYLLPSEYDAIVKILDHNCGNIIKQFGGVISGLTTSGGGAVVTVAAGSAFGNGVYMSASSSSTYTLPGATVAGTHKVYISPVDKTEASFQVLTTQGSVPSSGVYVADIVVANPGSSPSISSVTDRRTLIPTVANHEHTGGSDGPQLANDAIAAGAAIAYSKLNLAGSITNADISVSAAIAYSKLTLTNSIVNGDVSSSAAIAYSKLNLAGSIVNADISASAAITYSKLSLTGAIVNADISASAAIAYSKLNLTGSLQYADMAASSAKIKVYDIGGVTLGTAVFGLKPGFGMNMSVTSNEATVKTTKMVADNSAAAATPGTVTKKVEVFDSTGASLGYVAVYDAIT